MLIEAGQFFSSLNKIKTQLINIKIINMLLELSFSEFFPEFLSRFLKILIVIVSLKIEPLFSLNASTLWA